MSFVQKEEGLRETKQHDQIDDAKCEHVTGDHGEDHRHKRSGQTNGSCKEHQQEPAGWHGEHKDGFFGVCVADDAKWNAGE